MYGLLCRWKIVYILVPNTVTKEEKNHFLKKLRVNNHLKYLILAY